mgnify:CR=1 FL=1
MKKGFGATYAKGIRAGICLSASKEGRAHKVPLQDEIAALLQFAVTAVGQPVSACVSGDCGRTQVLRFTCAIRKILVLCWKVLYTTFEYGDEP